MKVLMIAAEAVPFAKVGGLADVVGALPAALKSLGVDVRVVIPRYQRVDPARYGLVPLNGGVPVNVFLGRIPVPCRFLAGTIPGTEIPVYFAENEFFFDRPGIYDDPSTGVGYADNGERFSFFSKAAIALLGELQWFPDILHCHDSQTGLVPAYLKLQLQQNSLFQKIGSVFTIHNLGYQGIFPREILYPASIPEESFYPESPLEFFGKVNYMKAALCYADCINAVSETYAQEIQRSKEFGYGLEGVLLGRSQDVFGIINGIDYSLWNPELDKLIPFQYSAGDLQGKAANKAELLRRCGLQADNPDQPLIGMISRLADQKGFDLVAEKLDELMSLPLRLVILGSGNKRYEEMLQDAAIRYPGRLSVNLKFDDPLAHQIEAGSDMFLMPSKYEPCGLNQLYSLRYGTIPIVRATGGLKDSVIDGDARPFEGTGFSFDAYTSDAMLDTIRRALWAFSDHARWTDMMQRAMAADFSWNRSAVKYVELYQRAMTKRNSS
jgi:starch synthase